MRTREIEYEKENGCYICTSHIPNKIGYPKLMKDGVIWTVKDYIYSTKIDSIGEDEEIILTCGERLCIHPAHMQKIPKKPFQLGDKNSRSILTEKQVVEVKRMLRNGVRKKVIAETFDVSPGCIYGISAGKSWKHID
jgi:hypothetical protein